MKANIDDTLNRLARRTHSPRGQQAASDQIYQQLLDRIPAEQRPAAKQVCRKANALGVPSGCVVGQQKRKQRTFFSRWSAAACLLLVVGIGLAIAGVWYHQYYDVPSATESLSVEQSDANNEPRTFIYQQAPLSDIVAELSAIYHVPVRIANPALQDYCITATFSTEESLTEILSILAEIGDFEVQETSDGYVIDMD